MRCEPGGYWQVRWEGGYCERAADSRPYVNTPLHEHTPTGDYCDRAADSRPYVNTPLRGRLGRGVVREGENFLFLFLSLRQKSKIFASLIRGRLSGAVGRGKAKKKALRVSAAPCM